MKLLVTGGAGYIGSVVALQLVTAGHEVTVLDNLSKGHEATVPEDADFVRADLIDAGRLARLLDNGYDGVLHFAALSLVGESVEQPERYYRVNVAGTLNLLEAMRAANVLRLVFSSTAAVYGMPEELPILETAPTRPTNPYGGSKLAADQLIGFFASAHGLSATSLRLEAVEAPRRAGDPPVLAASSALIREELGWTPEKPSLEAMISDAWDWMQEHPRGYEKG